MVDEHAGYPTRTVIKTTKGRYPLFTDEEFDVVLDTTGAQSNDWHWIGLVDLLRNGDIWNAFFDSTFFPQGQERNNRLVLLIIRTSGIRTIMVPHGMDVFFRDERVTRFDWVARAQVDYPAWDLAEHRSLAEARTAMFCAHADFVIASDSTVNRFLPRRDLSMKWFPVDCSALERVTPEERTVPLIIHAPQHRHIKGTQYLIDAIARLNERGIKCHLQLIEHIPRKDALLAYATADIIADQFCMGGYGLFALEGLALGKPVLCYLDEEHLGDRAFNLPLINTNPHNLEQVLAALVLVPELRHRVGHQSRESVVRYQSIEALAEVWNCIYQSVWWGRALELDATTHFSVQRGTRSFTENPSRADFWPVVVDDLLPEIQRGIACIPRRRISVVEKPRESSLSR